MRSLAPIVACVWISGVVAAGCGGSQSEAKEPDESAEPAHAKAKAEKAEPAEKASSDDDGDGDDDKKGSKAGSEENGDKGGASDEGKDAPKALRSAKDIVTGKDVLFVLSFNASEPYQAAEKKCTDKSGGDPKKKADCLSKASNQFDPDGITFEQDADGKWTWLTMHRKGNQLIAIHKIPIEFSDDKDKSVKVKTLGPDKGKKPMAHVPKEFVIDVPSETQISITDPKNGKMVYEAKLGLKGDAKR